jgi:hypothetical protein
MEEQRHDRNGRRNEERVQEIAEKIYLREHIDEIVESRMPRDQVDSEHLACVFDRHRGHPEEWANRHQRKDGAGEIEGKAHRLKHRSCGGFVERRLIHR